MRFLLVLFLFSAFFSRCEKAVNNTETPDFITEEIPIIIDPFHTRTMEIISLMDDKLLAAQVLISGIDGRGSLQPHMITLLKEYPAGGIMLFRFNLDTDNDSIRSLISETVSLINDESGIPPFVAVDHEGGTVNRFRRGVASLPAAISYWEVFLEQGWHEAISKIKTDSENAGREISDLGFNMNFAPVAEYLNDDNQDFLYSRSYGPDPFFAGEAAYAFIKGMEQAGILCVLKHFPGSSGPDPHYSASVINTEKASLEKLVYPFSVLIERGAGAVMAAHTLVPSIDDRIASLSPVIMGNWLRDELGFNGIIISDDFIMASAGGSNPAEAAVMSIAAGSDMILVWPADLKRTHEAFISALENGKLSRERLQEAVYRVIYKKLQMGLLY